MKNKYLPQILLSLAGVLFSGYLIFSKLFVGSCPLNEGCSYFLGYPSCYFGFAFFVTLLVLSLLNKLKALQIIAALAIIFAIYSTYIDLAFPRCPGGVCRYTLLLPTCVYGLAMYLGIYIFSLPRNKQTKV